MVEQLTTDKTEVHSKLSSLSAENSQFRRVLHEFASNFTDQHQQQPNANARESPQLIQHLERLLGLLAVPRRDIDDPRVASNSQTVRCALRERGA